MKYISSCLYWCE